jgi:hypothetical protein
MTKKERLNLKRQSLGKWRGIVKSLRAHKTIEALSNETCGYCGIYGDDGCDGCPLLNHMLCGNCGGVALEKIYRCDEGGVGVPKAADFTAAAQAAEVMLACIEADIAREVAAGR